MPKQSKEEYLDTPLRVVMGVTLASVLKPGFKKVIAITNNIMRESRKRLGPFLGVPNFEFQFLGV